MADFLDDFLVNGTVRSAAWIDSQGGKRAIRVFFDLEQPLVRGDRQQDEIKHDIWITEKTANMAHKVLKTLGVDSDTVDAQKFRYEINELLLGAKALLVCAIEEANQYHPEDEWRVKFVNDWRDNSLEPPDPLLILRKRVAKPSQGKKAKPEPTPIERAASLSTAADDDTPF